VFETKKKAVTVTRRSTAGTGFDFEDCVAAWFLLQALAGRGVSVEGSVQRLQMQTGSLHWDVDDLLVTTQAETVARRLAVSCKGNVQVSANGLPESFAAQAWRLWTKSDSQFAACQDEVHQTALFAFFAAEAATQPLLEVEAPRTHPRASYVWAAALCWRCSQAAPLFGAAPACRG
jgi:hypothetical protein